MRRTNGEHGQHPIRYPDRWVGSSAPLLVATALLLVVDAAWGLYAHWSFSSHGLASLTGVPAALMLPLTLARYRNSLPIRTVILCAAGFICFSMTAADFSYLVVSTNAPLVDDKLAAFDRMLGFDWPAMFEWVQHRNSLNTIFGFAYSGVTVQIAVVTVYLAFTKRFEQLAEFNLILVITSVVTIGLSGFFPAEGPFKYYAAVTQTDASMLSDFEPTRQGVLRTLDFVTAQGLVSMPSFHAIMALLLIYGLRGTRIWILMLMLNVLVLLSTPTRGGHYLVDLIAGALTFAIVVIAVRVWPARLLSSNPQAPGDTAPSGVERQPFNPRANS
ncbi:phosphatase PAP2 family protein [Paraburkholderia sediminicola]|uniref:phosphatase PAP2 family protein n=1 Tax=Paraburkholderia sediminicola TaxID=458836 RepID=UPI0038B80ECF